MTTQFRDTQFGHLVRFLSHRTLFRYPDEANPSLWKESVSHKGDTFAQPNGGGNSSVEKLRTQSDSPQDASLGCVVERGKDIVLVDWYGPEDPEVIAPTDSTH